MGGKEESVVIDRVSVSEEKFVVCYSGRGGEVFDRTGDETVFAFFEGYGRSQWEKAGG